MFHATTHAVTITVTPEFNEAESWPQAGRFLFTYHVEIHNGSAEKLQLLRRYWRIYDAFNRVYEVEGEGVLGKQPFILPDKTHFYSSACPLNTPSGKMEGHYLMQGAGKGIFIAQIPSFPLISPYETRH